MGGSGSMERTPVFLLILTVVTILLVATVDNTDFADISDEAEDSGSGEAGKLGIKSFTPAEDFKQSSQQKIFPCKTIALKGSKGLYLSAHTGGRVRARKMLSPLRTWEMFQVVSCPGRTVCFKSKAYHNKYLQATPNGMVKLSPRFPRTWERFRVAKRGRTITLKSHHGKYLTAQPNGLMQCIRSIPKALEQFTYECH